MRRQPHAEFTPTLPRELIVQPRTSPAPRQQACPQYRQTKHTFTPFTLGFQKGILPSLQR
jgi:hypothetical protein